MIRFIMFYGLLLAVNAQGLIAFGYPQTAHAEEAVLRCTNQHSGVTWDVKVDAERGTVDAFPAHITQSRITWHDTVHGGYYDLDRVSGRLTVVYASSTGGYTLFHECHAG